MSSSEQLYAVVRFIETNTFSEIPTNWLHNIKDGNVKCWWPTKIRNVTSYIANRFPPDETTWDLCHVEIEQFCGNVYSILFLNILNICSNYICNSVA